MCAYVCLYLHFMSLFASVRVKGCIIAWYIKLNKVRKRIFKFHISPLHIVMNSLLIFNYEG